MELRMSSPSIIPNDRLDRDIYLLLEDFRSGSAWRETDEAKTDVSTVVEDLLTGQYDQPLRVVAFNPVERRSRDATEEIAEELDRRIAAEGREISEALQEFVESNIGRKIGVQLALPLRA
jgi:ribosomal protein L31E